MIENEYMLEEFLSVPYSDELIEGKGSEEDGKESLRGITSPVKVPVKSSTRGSADSVRRRQKMRQLRESTKVAVGRRPEFELRALVVKSAR